MADGKVPDSINDTKNVSCMSRLELRQYITKLRGYASVHLTQRKEQLQSNVENYHKVKESIESRLTECRSSYVSMVKDAKPYKIEGIENAVHHYKAYGTLSGSGYERLEGEVNAFLEIEELRKWMKKYTEQESCSKELSHNCSTVAELFSREKESGMRREEEYLAFRNEHLGQRTIIMKEAQSLDFAKNLINKVEETKLMDSERFAQSPELVERKHKSKSHHVDRIMSLLHSTEEDQ